MEKTEIENVAETCATKWAKPIIEKGETNYDFWRECYESSKECAEKIHDRDIELFKKFITDYTYIPYEGDVIDGEPEALTYIKWCQKRLSVANEIINMFDEFMKSFK